MMSQDHQLPGEGEEAGEDEEEGDMEARTAVAALLALTSPTDYTYTGYDENYIIEPPSDDYLDNTLSPKYAEEDVQMEAPSGELGEGVLNTSEMEIETGCLRATDVSGENESSALSSSECQDGDDGLAQLRAFVQVTEGKSDQDDASKCSDLSASVCREGSIKKPLNSVSVALPQKTVTSESSYSGDTGLVNSSVDISTNELKGLSSTARVSENSVLTGNEIKSKLEILESETLPKDEFDKSPPSLSNKSVSDVESSTARMPEKSSVVSNKDFVTENLSKGSVNSRDTSTNSGSDSDSDSDSDGDTDSDSSDSSSSSSSDSDSESDEKSESAEKEVSVSKDKEVKSDTPEKEQTVLPSQLKGAEVEISRVDKVMETSDNNEENTPKGNQCQSENKLSNSEVKDPSFVKAHASLGSSLENKTKGYSTNSSSEKEDLVCATSEVGKSSDLFAKTDVKKGSLERKVEKSEKVLKVSCEKNSIADSKDKVEGLTDTEAAQNSATVAKSKENLEKIKDSDPGKSIKPKLETDVEEKKNTTSAEVLSAKGIDHNRIQASNRGKENDSSCNNENKQVQKSRSSEEGLGPGSKTTAPKKCKRVQKPRETIRVIKDNLDKQTTVVFSQQVSSIQTSQVKVSPKDITSPIHHSEKEKNEPKASSSNRLNSRKGSGEILKSKDVVSSKLIHQNAVGARFPRKSSVSESLDGNYDRDLTEDKIESETDEMFPLPIQAEVVMSDGSESGIEYGDGDKTYQGTDSMQLYDKGGEVMHLSDKENDELVAYLQSFVNGGGEGEIIEYPPSNNELPADGTDLTQWQLDGVHLPPFTPNVAPPSWLRLTIPAEGYRCHSCGDTFFIESSLVQHRERRSVWINLECGPCDAKLTFYNRCALKDHLRMHLMHGEEVDEETVEVRSLPLQLTRLLQPIMVPVPHSLRAGKRLSISSKGCGSVTKLPTLKQVGKGTAKHSAGKLMNGTMDESYDDDTLSDSILSSPDKIPLGMKRLSPRRRTIRCYLCERMFHSVRELMAHMRTDQPYSDQRVECRKCQLVLPSVCAAKAHILTHPPANTSNVSVCPECGSRCDGPRDFVHHLNTCGHQFRRSGIVCTVCQVCFFKSQDDYLTHWILEHCEKSYECVVCENTFESLVFHNCQAPGQQVLATFRCLLTCPLCAQSVQLHAQEESDANMKVRSHLADCHPSIITRVHYVYKSKFCTNAFRSKDELRAHHDREHRRDNHYRTKTCTLHHEVLGYQHQYFNGQEPRNAFVTLPVALSAEELHEARIRDVPTVSSVIDKTLFPDVPSLENTKAGKMEKHSKTRVTGKTPTKDAETKDLSLKDSPVKKDFDQLDKLRPTVCYRCGYMYVDNKNFRRHKRTCDGEARERQCQVCGVTAIGEDFARHCLGHIQEGVILCIYCNGTRFSNSIDLEQHFELHVHEQFSYPASCAFCSASLPDVPTALAHLNEEHDPFHVPLDTSEFECNRCGRRFHGERGLSVHLGRCTLGTATPALSSTGCRQCQVCTKALTTEMFGRHMVCHLEEGLLVCSLCDGRTLPSSMALLHHLEEHAAALAYPSLCPMCSFAMLDSTSALTHLKEEHGFGNLHCAECDMHYNFTYQLQRHTDIVHKICLYAKRRYICWICRAYDHVKKETLMNHFRTVHGLDREQVDEKVMIRTRGQGTMPTSQFIPTKPLGSKEVPGLVSPNKVDTESGSAKPHKEKSKVSPSKSHVTVESPDQPQSESIQGTSTKLPSSTPSSPLTKKIIIKKKDDIRLKDKMKVLIKRLPDSVLDDHSRSKRRKLAVDEKKPTKKLKKRKPKAYKCSICGFGTNNKEKHDNHILKHKNALKDVEPDDFVCTECGASFVVEPSLARHMFFAHKVKLPVTSVEESDLQPSVEEEHVERDVKCVSVVEKRKDIKSETESVQTESNTGSEVKKKKISPVLEKVEVKKENGAATSKEEPEIQSKPIKEEKLESKMSTEAKETVIKRKVAKVSGLKKQNKEVSRVTKVIPKIKTEKDKPEKEITKVTTEKEKVEKEMAKITAEKVKIEKEIPKIKTEKDQSRRKAVKETNKKRNMEASAKKTISKGISKNRETKESVKKRDRDLKKKNPKSLSRKKGDKLFGAAKWGSDSSDVISDDRCVVCKEKFTNPVELYSHLRTHGMAFLKLGRKARPFGVEKHCDQ